MDDTVVEMEYRVMHMIHSTRAALGWDAGLDEQLGVRQVDRESVGRVASVDRDQLLILSETGPLRAKLSGTFAHKVRSSAERPCVGDWVWFAKSPADPMGLIQGVLGRRTCLRRKTAGETVDYQMIAANVDVVFIVQSCHYDFNPKRLERYLVMVLDGGATPVFLLTKTDLIDRETLDSQLRQVKAICGDVPVVPLSQVSKDGMNELRQLLLPQKTHCFVGSSGVGKSTLINGLMGDTILETNTVSDTGEGRHTTVRRELLVLKNGSLVIDNPGMREFGILGAEHGITESYSTILALATTCRFSNCTHHHEAGCAVLAAVQSGDLDSEHHKNFLKLKGESEFLQASYVERRKKDKAFGKFMKTAKKEWKAGQSFRRS